MNTDEFVSVDTILDWLTDQVKNKIPIDPLRYLDAATKLNILSSDENDKLIEMESDVAKMRVSLLEEGQNATTTRMRIEATDEYKALRKQRARLEQITEAIRLGKIAARIKNDEMGRAKGI